MKGKGKDDQEEQAIQASERSSKQIALDRCRSRDRQVQRVMLDEATIYDRMIHDEIDDWGKTNNSTK